MTIKSKCLSVFIALSLIALTLTGCSSGQTTDTAAESAPMDSISSNTSINTSSEKEEAEDPIEVQDEIIDAAETFLKAYLEFNTKDNGGVYDINVIYQQYASMLTSAAQQMYQPDPDAPTDQVDSSSTVSDIHTYVSQKSSDTATTVSVLTITSDVSGIHTAANYVVNLMLSKHGDSWLIEGILNNKLIDIPVDSFY